MDRLTLDALSDETISMMIAAQPALRGFFRTHSDCSEVWFSRTKVHCADCDINNEGPSHEPYAPLVVGGGARAALKRVREGKPHKSRHRKTMRERLASIVSNVTELNRGDDKS
jgi:hypothetical protein